MKHTSNSKNTTDFSSALQQGIQVLGLEDVGAEQQDKLLHYIDLLVQWNKVYNLTAVRNPAEMLTHHVLDSLAIIAPLRKHTQGRALPLLDVGSGGGLPGVVIAICCPEIQVTCVDTVAKKRPSSSRWQVCWHCPISRQCIPGLKPSARHTL